MIQQGEYLKRAQDLEFITRLRSDFSFLAILPEGKSLEGFLYPDTYFLDAEKSVVDQLIKSQLKNWEKRIWSRYRDQFLTFAPQ